MAIAANQVILQDVDRLPSLVARSVLTSPTPIRDGASLLYSPHAHREFIAQLRFVILLLHKLRRQALREAFCARIFHAAICFRQNGRMGSWTRAHGASVCYDV